MNALSDLAVEDFRDYLTPERLFAQKMVAISLLAGVFMFLIMMAVTRAEALSVFYDSGRSAMIVVNLVLAVSSLACALLAPNVPLPAVLRSNATSPAPVSNETAARACFAVIQILMFVRLALVESAALFGAACAFIGAGWVNLLGVIPMMIIWPLVFPTYNRVMRTFIVEVKKDPRLVSLYMK